MAELRIETGSGDPAMVAITDRALILGRSPDVDLQIADQRLSRHHCKLELQGQKLIVTDLGSSNGTFARGQRITRVAIDPGESFFIGKTKISFNLQGGAAPTPIDAGSGPREDPTAPMRRAEVMAQGPQAAAYAPPASPPPVGGAHPLYAGGGLAPTPPPQPVYAPPPQPAYPPAPAAYAQPGAWGAPAPTTRGVPPAPGPFADTGPLGASSRAAAPQGFAPPPPPAPARSSGERAPAARSAPVAPPPPAAPRDTHGVEPSPIEGYQIFDRLGEGSMGTVYSARSLDTGEVCVLKTIKFDGSSKDAIFFIREAQTGTKLKHPSIVRVLDFGEAGGILFLAMEFVGGGSLLDRIKRQGPLTNREAHAHLAAMADALEYAGKKKFVHRDIKPANILLTTEGEPKLADFGLAKMMAESGAMALTKVGETRGTPIYMPPELLSNAADADGRADIYSLGATYYHALTGFHPFRANSVIEILRMVVEVDPQPIEERNPRVHPSLIQVIRRCMRKKKEERFQNAAELIAELQRIAPEIA